MAPVVYSRLVTMPRARANNSRHILLLLLLCLGNGVIAQLGLLRAHLCGLAISDYLRSLST